MKTLLRIALAPVMLVLRLMLGLAAFVTSIASSVIGLSVTLFALLAGLEFFIGYWQNGIAFLVLALLASAILSKVFIVGRLLVYPVRSRMESSLRIICQSSSCFCSISSISVSYI